MITAFIPARGGSKTVPGKNIKEFAGKPLIIHSIEYALQSKLIEEVVVSTDNSKITSIANSAGARVINRPEELATDTATTESAIHHYLNKFSKNWALHCYNFCKYFKLNFNQENIKLKLYQILLTHWEPDIKKLWWDLVSGPI